MASENSTEEDKRGVDNFDALVKDLKAEAEAKAKADGKQKDSPKKESPLMQYLKLAEQDLIGNLDIGESEQKERSLKIQSFFNSRHPLFKDLTDVIDHQTEQGNSVRALVLVKWANDYGKFDSGVHAASYRYLCISQLITEAYKIVRKNIPKTNVKLMAIAKKYGEPVMVEMYEKIKQIQLSDNEYKVNKDAISCHLITSVRGFLGMYNKAIESGEECIAMLEEKFGPDPKKIQTFGHALTVIGLAYNKLGKLVLGGQYLKESYQAKKGAADFADEKTREDYIEYTKSLMKQGFLLQNAQNIQ